LEPEMVEYIAGSEKKAKEIIELSS
jgi:hypothetical protein